MEILKRASSLLSPLFFYQLKTAELGLKTQKAGGLLARQL
jgi:hypothetical protein